jgi:hypothetical protein
MRTIGYWLSGFGFLQFGHTAIRILEQFVPRDSKVIDPPLWTAALLAAAGAMLLWAGSGVRRGRPAARAVAIAWIVGWVGATLLAINSDTLDRFRWGHTAAARDGVWRASAWPSMLGSLDRFTWRPTGRWALPEFAAAIGCDAAAIAMIAVLMRPLHAGEAPPGETPEARDARVRVALLREEANPTPGASLLRAVLALHLAAIAIFMLIAIIGLCARVAGWRLSV